MLDTAQGLKDVEQFRDAVMAAEAIAKLVAEMGGILPPQIDIRAGGEAIDIILSPLSFDLEKLREYNAQSRPQGNGNCQWKEKDMGEIEWASLNDQKKGHKAIETAIKDLSGLGYLVSGISYKNGDLEIDCCLPGVEKNREYHSFEEQGIEFPLPPRVIPDVMGINLCAVKGMSWEKLDDGQLVTLSIHFKPDSVSASLTDISGN